MISDNLNLDDILPVNLTPDGVPVVDTIQTADDLIGALPDGAIARLEIRPVYFKTGTEYYVGFVAYKKPPGGKLHREGETITFVPGSGSYQPTLAEALQYAYKSYWGIAFAGGIEIPGYPPTTKTDEVSPPPPKAEKHEPRLTNWTPFLNPGIMRGVPPGGFSWSPDWIPETEAPDYWENKKQEEE